MILNVVQYRSIFFLLSFGIYISLDLGHIWSDEVYVDEVYDHTKLSKVVYMLSMYAYIKYVVILIIYTTVVTF